MAKFENGFDDFIATDLTKYKGISLGAVPWSAGTFAMVYRTDVMKAAGINDLPKTWTEMLDDSRAIKKKTGKTGFAFAAAHQVWFPVNYYLWSNDSAFVVEDGKGGYKLGVTQDDLVKAINYFKSYIDEGLAPRSILSIDTCHMTLQFCRHYWTVQSGHGTHATKYLPSAYWLHTRKQTLAKPRRLIPAL